MMPLCPICGTAARPRADNKYYPFCSQRCQLVDLGRWLNEDYRIPGEPEDGQSGDDHEEGTT